MLSFLPDTSCRRVYFFALFWEDSFDRPPGQQEPSLLDYSLEQQGGPVLAVGSRLLGDARSGGVGRHTGESPSALLASAEAALATATSREVPSSVEEGHLTGIVNCERINVTAEECGTGDNTDDAFPNSISGVEDDAPEAPQDVDDPRRNRPAAVHEGPGARRGGEGGVIAGIGIGAGDGIVSSDASLNGVAAKVKTRRSPRRKLPAYLSASPNGLGAASRWGALSKAHLEFHRLGTAGE